MEAQSIETIRAQMPAFATAHVAGQTSQIRLPVGGYVYHELALLYSGVTLAQMELRLKANGIIVHEYSGVERDTINQFDKLVGADAAHPTSGTGILVLPMERVGLDTKNSRYRTALNTNTVADNDNFPTIKQLELEVDIASGAASPSLQLLPALVSKPLFSGPGDMLYVRRHTRSFSGAGTYKISDLPFRNFAALKLNRLHFVASVSDAITEIKVHRNLAIIDERIRAHNELINSNGGIRANQSGWVTYDRTADGVGNDLVDVMNINNFDVELSLNAACSITLIAETIGASGG